jgi:DNA ligase 1
MTKIFPTLYKKTQTGAVQQWLIGVDGSIIHTVHGLVGGAQQTFTDTIREGKNLGRANATTPEEQASLEAEAKWLKQKKKGYVEDAEAAAAGEVDETIIEGGIAPMLAPSKIWPIFRDRIKFPVWCQPKLDGMRCVGMCNGLTTSLWSRTRKSIQSLPHIADEIDDLFRTNDGITDGEAYSVEYHDQFEELLSIIRKDEPSEKSSLVDYHIYDLPSHPGTFSARYEALSKLLPKKIGHLVPVRTVLCRNDTEIEACHEQNLAENYEGTMIRSDGPYEFGKRSFFLQKYKNFSDAEYPVLRAEEGRGKDAGTVGSFVCVTPGGKEFGCRLKSTYERRRELFQNPEQWQGRYLTVKYQNLTADGIPRFPVGKGLRADVGQDT